MNLVFRDMTLKIKIFSNPHHHLDDVNVEKVNAIECLVQEYFDSVIKEEPNYTTASEWDELINENQFQEDNNEEMISEVLWAAHFEPLPLETTLVMPSNLKVPQ